jgi:hypothetical protein
MSRESYVRAHAKHGEAGSMHAFRAEAARLSEPFVSAARWNWKKRRLYSRLRIFARRLASGMIDIRGGLLKALHDSRSLLAARVIDQHRHLVQDHRSIGVLRCADDAGFELRQTEPMEQ